MATTETPCVKFTAGLFWVDFQGEQRTLAPNRVLRGDYRKLTANEAESLEYYRATGGSDKSLLWHN